MWKQVLVWALNAILIVAVGVAWVLVGDSQGTWQIEENGGEWLTALEIISVRDTAQVGSKVRSAPSA